MAESIGPSSAKKQKRSAPVARVSAEDRAKQFKEDLYADGKVLFCKYCQHSIDYIRVDTIKDHLKSKKHTSNKETKQRKEGESSAGSSSRQLTLSTVVKSYDARQEFLLDYIKICTLADIPLEKTDKMRPFLRKYCPQAGALPQIDQLRSTYIPRLFEGHFSALMAILKDQPVSITADETMDIRDQSILNVVATVRGQPYLINVVKLAACNNSTFSQAIIRSVTGAGIEFDHVIAIVSDSAAYCKKAYRDVLSVVFTKSTHILCLAHVVNLAAEVFQHFSDFKHTADLVAMIKSSLFKKPGRKRRYLTYISDFIASTEVKLPPVPVSTRWNSWFEAVIYHATRVHLYEGFYKAEKGSGMAVQRIIELLGHKTIYPEIILQLYFIKENCQRLITILTALEAKTTPLACKAFNYMEDLRMYLKAGIHKTTFGTETDRLLSKLPESQRKKYVKSFQEVFRLSSKKLESHLDAHPAYAYYKAVRVFDPRQLAIVEHDIADYQAIPGLQCPTTELHEEWLIYMQLPPDSIATSTTIPAFWKSMAERYPLLSAVAMDAIWMPVALVDCERSFSQYKHILNDRRVSLTEENTKRLLMLYHNGDIEGRFE